MNILNIISLILKVFTPNIAVAAEDKGLFNCSTGDVSACGPKKDPYEMITFAEKALTYVLVIGGFVALVGIVYGAILYFFSAGDVEKIKRGNRALTASITGLIIIVLSYVLLRVFTQLLGGDITQP